MTGGRFAAAASRRDTFGDEAMLPLVNVVLLLLVFFMVAGSLRLPEAFPVTPPRAEGEAAQGRGPLRVAMAVDGRLALDGRALSRVELLAAVKPGVAVTLRADGGIEAAEALALARALQGAGAGTVDLLVLAP